MKNIICGIVGFVIGAGGGYAVARLQYRKKLEKELQSIEDTQKELYSKKIDESKSDEEEQEELDGHPDVYALAEEEIRNGEANNIPARFADDATDEDSEENDDDGYIDYDEKAKLEFQKMFEGYVGTGIPYPITQDQYEEDGFNTKMRLIYYPEEDKAYDDFTKTEYESFHTDIGDEEYDTLNQDYCFDAPGVWYIRNDKEGIDFEVETSNRILEDMPAGMI